MLSLRFLLPMGGEECVEWREVAHALGGPRSEAGTSRQDEDLSGEFRVWVCCRPASRTASRGQPTLGCVIAALKGAGLLGRMHPLCSFQTCASFRELSTQRW